jgi:hypothetical protein
MSYVNTVPESDNACNLSRHPATPQLTAREQRSFVKHYGWYGDHEQEITLVKRINSGRDEILWPPFTQREVE